MAKQIKEYVNLFTMNPTKKGFVLKPKIGNYGVKKIIVETLEGKKLELDAETAIWMNEISGKTKAGKEYSFYSGQITL